MQYNQDKITILHGKILHKEVQKIVKELESTLLPSHIGRKYTLSIEKKLNWWQLLDIMFLSRQILPRLAVTLVIKVYS